MRAVFFLALAVHDQVVFDQLEAQRFRLFALALFDDVVLELVDPAALHADDVIVMMAAFEKDSATLTAPDRTRRFASLQQYDAMYRDTLQALQAEAAIRRTNAAVVVVDTTGLAFAADLVRNDPFLRNRPKMIDLAVMRPTDAAAVCSHGRVVMFDKASGSNIRPLTFRRDSLVRMAAARRAMTDLGCATERIVMR